jgi:hypothetical protein
MGCWAHIKNRKFVGILKLESTLLVNGIVVSILPSPRRSLLPWFCMTCAFSAVFRVAKFGFTVIVVVIDARAKRPFPLVKLSQDSPSPTSPSEKHTFSSISHQGVYSHSILSTDISISSFVTTVTTGSAQRKVSFQASSPESGQSQSCQPTKTRFRKDKLLYFHQHPRCLQGFRAIGPVYLILNTAESRPTWRVNTMQSPMFQSILRGISPFLAFSLSLQSD